MNNLLTHYPVNWIDGMRLSSRTHSYYTRHELQETRQQGAEKGYEDRKKHFDSIKKAINYDKNKCPTI